MYSYNYWFSISITIFIATLLLCLMLNVYRAFEKNRRKQFWTPGKIFFIGLFLSAFACFMPLYLLGGVFDTSSTVLFSLQQALGIFALNGNFSALVSEALEKEAVIPPLYIKYGGFLCVLAPAITFTFVLTFFKNVLAHLKYSAFKWAKPHIFSELNEKSLALAKSIARNHKPYLWLIPSVLIVFTDIIDEKKESHLDLVEEAAGMGAILFRKDLESLHFRRILSRREINFYLISDDESEKIRHAESIMNHYDFKCVNLWIFSNDIRTELMVAKNNTKNIKITRVNDIQALIYHNLDENGVHLFERALKINGKSNKVISAVIVGLGKYGREMLKALAWFCQMEGYELKINAFDIDEKSKEKFTAQCPELMSDKYNKNENPQSGEAYYSIDIHNGIDVNTPEFENKLKEIEDISYIFISLGDDKINLSTASRIRSICEMKLVESKNKVHGPDIETVIYNSNVREKLGTTWDYTKDFNSGEKNNKSRYDYNIMMIGDLNHFYSEETVINSELADAALDVHKFWSIEPAKIAFTVNHMEAEWKKFIEDEKLEDSWEKHLKDHKTKNNNDPKTKSDCLKLSDSISSFFYEIKKEKPNNADKETIDELKNTAIGREDKWEKLVYEKFKNFTGKPFFEFKGISTIFESLNNLFEKLNFILEWKKINAAKTKEAERTFRIEYNYRSSITKAIHKRLKIKLGFKPQITMKSWEEMTLDDKIEIGKAEHVRWNAYMRTEGYRCANQRNDLAKLHNKLVNVSELSNDDLRKDS